ESEPLQALLRRNWLASCGAAFRSATVTLDYFDGETRYCEWTLLAFRLAMNLSLKFLDVPTFRIHATPHSLSKSTRCLTDEIVAIDKMLAIKPPVSLLPVLTRLRCAALHAVADFHREQGNYRLAWKFHLDSIRHPHGWKHLLFTRKLFFP